MSYRIGRKRSLDEHSPVISFRQQLLNKHRQQQINNNYHQGNNSHQRQSRYDNHFRCQTQPRKESRRFSNSRVKIINVLFFNIILDSSERTIASFFS
jgi:hypothetical protein